MTIAEPIVLPADVVLVPVDELPPAVREQIEHGSGDYAVTRPRTRQTSSIVDRSTALLLERFRDPKTIVDAVIDHARSEELDPGETLEHAFPMLARFLNAGMLVPAGSELAETIDATLAPGDHLAGFTLLEPVHVIDDTEVHLARAPDGSLVALKIVRDASLRGVVRAFDHEAAVLSRLSGTVNPALHARGSADGREFLAVAWCAGVDAVEAAAELRERGDTEGLLELGGHILDAYAQLHGEGVLHGDVHPRNVLAKPGGGIALIDFGLAVVAGLEIVPPRGGIDLFHEPELARARLTGGPPPALDSAGEQYSVAALLYLVLTGAHTHAFALEEEQMLRQLVEEPLLPFTIHGADDTAVVEEPIARALAREPHLRYPSLAAFRDAYRAARAGKAAPVPRARRRTEASRLLADVVTRLAGPLLAGPLEAPTASVNLGAAGLAYGALRIAAARDDAELLALAERWSARAATSASTPEGFENAELDVSADGFGRASLHHSSVGVHCVDALVAHARGDEPGRELAIERFADAVRTPSPHLDVAFGAAGALLGAALLHEAAPTARAVVAAGDELAAALLDATSEPIPVSAGSSERSLGAAHGWAGFLYALLRWSEALGLPAPPEVRGRLDELAALGVPLGRGLRWPREAGLPAGENPLVAAWCNGAAGHVHLWLAAERAFGEPRFASLAEAAAWTACDAPIAGGDLCCGAAGRAYALLAVHRQLGGGSWLERAAALTERAAHGVRRDCLRRDSLYKGEVGVAALAAELDRPDWAAMPLFESEGWPRTGTAASSSQGRSRS
jgi:eukaryotic-like serine/threonine-protein kinase